MTEYESSGFEPPAPVAIVTLRNPHNGKLRTDVQMLLDTGADVSLVPASTLNELELRPDRDRSYEILGFDGRSSFARVAPAGGHFPWPFVPRPMLARRSEHRSPWPQRF